MTTKLKRSSIFLSILLLSTAAFANPVLPTATPANIPVANAAPQPQSIFNTPTAAQPQLTPVVPNVNANGFVLMDGASGKILASKNLDQRVEPASLTKMMTSYIVSMALREGRIHLDDLVPISEAAWRTGGSKMFVKVNDHVAVRDLMQGIIVDSGNDACVAMAEFVAGSQDSFVGLMNQEAQRLGMTGTHFMDVNGLPDPNHYTTPHDMAVLARALIYDFPEDYKWYSQKWFAYNGIKQPNRNRLLWRDPSVDGVKTGHTDGAGFCLVASGQRNGTRLISVVMGAPTDAARADDSEQLLTFGFRFFETHKLYSANSELIKARIWSGETEQLPVGVLQDTYVTIPPGQYNNLKTNLTLNNQIKAPVQKGQTLGNLNVTLNGKPVSTIPLVALQDDPKGGIWRRMVDHIRLWF
jgi:D-alanyl-D-alanine carboxypeptidase (penicillin-binding protein 5/6)